MVPYFKDHQALSVRQGSWAYKGPQVPKDFKVLKGLQGLQEKPESLVLLAVRDFQVSLVSEVHKDTMELRASKGILEYLDQKEPEDLPMFTI